MTRPARTTVTLALFLACVVSALLSSVTTAFGQSTQREVVVGQITGIVDPVTVGYVDRTLTEAERSNSAAVVFTLDTPGGLTDSVAEIDQRIQASRVPVILSVARGSSAAGLQAPVIDDSASNLPDLLRRVDGAQVHLAAGDVTLATADASTRRADMSPLEAFLHTITNPTIAYILLGMGSLALLLELYHPGSIFPGVLGGLCLLLAVYGLTTLPLNIVGLGLLGFAVLLFALEPFLTSHGILAAGGAVAFVIGSLMLINAPDAPYLQVPMPAIAGTTGVFVVFFLVIVAAIIRSRRAHVVTGHEGLLGAVGKVRRPIEPGRQGLVLVHGELWQAISDRVVPVEATIVVTKVDGLLLTVQQPAGTIRAPRRPAAPAAAKADAARR